jgi:hypothetical protein
MILFVGNFWDALIGLFSAVPDCETKKLSLKMHIFGIVLMLIATFLEIKAVDLFFPLRSMSAIQAIFAMILVLTVARFLLRAIVHVLQYLERKSGFNTNNS